MSSATPSRPDAFNDAQVTELKATLDQRNVKEVDKGSFKAGYIEGWHAIAEANRIFGFGMWDRRLTMHRQVQDTTDEKGKHRIGYIATVEITVRVDDSVIVREGSGFGQGIDKDLGQAHESAIKEAETDAMKRALMTFGNPFGLALYDKAKTNVSDHEADALAKQQAEANAGLLKLCDEQLGDLQARAKDGDWDSVKEIGAGIKAELGNIRAFSPDDADRLGKTLKEAATAMAEAQKEAALPTAAK